MGITLRARHILGTCILLAACGGSSGTREEAAPTTPPGQPGSPRVLVIDPSAVVVNALVSGLQDSVRTVVSDDSAWRQLWNQVYSIASPMPPVPVVNFSQDRLIVAALGSRPSAGYSVAIDSVTTENGATTVYVTRQGPGASCMNATLMTAPVQVVRVSGDLGIMSFRETARVVDC